MSSETIFNEIITLINEIHNIRPNMKFGRILQLSIDYHKRKKNLDLTQVSSKELMTGLKLFKDKLESEQ